MKTLISGASGFIASHLSKQLLDLGHQVIPITQAQLYEPLALQELFRREKPDYIFNLASYGNMANQKDIPMIVFANIIGTFNMLSASNDINYKRFIQFSTSSVNLPIETYYSAAKKGAEALCNAFRIQEQKPITVVRPYSVFGEGEADFRFIPTICRSLITGEKLNLDPTPMHDWIYVKDFVNILLSSLHEDLIEIGTGVKVSNEYIYDTLAKISGKKSNIEEVKGLRNYDNSEWQAHVNFQDLTPIEEALKSVYKYYEEKYTS